MKYIFNSLGSNYSFDFVMESLKLLVFRPKYYVNNDKLAKYLQTYYKGVAFLFYKGRGAITSCLNGFSVREGDRVLIQAFTCLAVEEGVLASGSEPVFVDVGKKSLNMTLSNLKKAYKKHPKSKAVIVQHTLGYPADIEVISKWCEKK